MFCVGAIALTALTATTTGASAGVTVARDGRAISHSGATAAPVVCTAGGAVRGKTTATTDEFLGIPYAAPPVGSLPLAPAAPAAGWKGVRDAGEFAPHCAQPGGTPFGIASTSEDCLYLNVYGPAGGQHSGTGRPVMVWIHGGGYGSVGVRTTTRPSWPPTARSWSP